MKEISNTLKKKWLKLVILLIVLCPIVCSAQEESSQPKEQELVLRLVDAESLQDWQRSFYNQLMEILCDGKSQKEDLILKYAQLGIELPEDALEEKAIINHQIRTLIYSHNTTNTTEKECGIKEYNKLLLSAKTIMTSQNKKCDECRKDPNCKEVVIAKLQEALACNPKGKEAKRLLECMTK